MSEYRLVGAFFLTGEVARRAGAVKSNWQWAVDVG